MRDNEWLAWLGLEFRGFDDDADTDDDDDGDDANDDDDDDDDDDEDDDPKAATKALREALQKERRSRRQLEKEVKKLRKGQIGKPVEDDGGKPKPSDSDNADLTAATKAAEKAQTEAERAKGTAAKLAARLRDTEVNRLIRAEAAKRFIDPEDAVAQVDRRSIEVDQDEDDPEDVEVDEMSVREAVKALAKKKPHLLKPKDEDGSGSRPSTSKFGGGRKRQNDGAEDEALRDLYPMLRR